MPCLNPGILVHTNNLTLARKLLAVHVLPPTALS
jgi:hypothetical protein